MTIAESINIPWHVLHGDVTETLQRLPADYFHACITSPPYYGLRAYLPPGHPDKAKEIGTEETPQAYVDRLVEVFRRVRRVLHPSAVIWLNLGDTFYSSPSGQNGTTGSLGGGIPCGGSGTTTGRISRPIHPSIKPKDLIGIPWMVAFALRDDGWYLRQECSWVKRSPMPESVEDRPGSATEKIFLLSKSDTYFYDYIATQKPARTTGRKPGGKKVRSAAYGDIIGRRGGQTLSDEPVAETRNRRSADWWFDSVGLLMTEDGEMLGFDVTAKGTKMKHFAAWPAKLVEPMVLAGTSEKGVCGACGNPWTRVIEKDRVPTRPGEDSKVNRASAHDDSPYNGHAGAVVGNRDPQRHVTVTRTVGWEPGCKCNSDVVPARILDVFCGSGTTLSVAVGLGRHAVGCELNEDYLELIRKRMRGTVPCLF
jgi:DNA modification methylase